MPRLLPAVLLVVLSLLGAPALGQDVQIRLGQSLRLDRSALEITADSLEVDQTTGSSVFSGNVLAVQGDMRIEAQHLRLDYVAGANEGSRRIDALRASGGVTMVTLAEAIEAREATYSMTNQTLEMSGEVVLVQGANMLSGERFVVNLNTGNGQMIGRVRTIIRME